jgi:hypothetical protein
VEVEDFVLKGVRVKDWTERDNRIARLLKGFCVDDDSRDEKCNRYV